MHYLIVGEGGVRLKNDNEYGEWLENIIDRFHADRMLPRTTCVCAVDLNEYLEELDIVVVSSPEGLEYRREIFSDYIEEE